jgi:hypothetical protein
MNNPFAYQNDLLKANNEMTNYLQGRATVKKNAAQKGILEKATDLRKKGEDLQKSAQDAQKAMEFGLGATVGPKTVEKLIKPVAQRLANSRIGNYIGGKVNNMRQGVNDKLFNRGSENRLSGARQVRGEKGTEMGEMKSNVGEERGSMPKNVPDRVEMDEDFVGYESKDGGETKSASLESGEESAIPRSVGENPSESALPDVAGEAEEVTPA